MGDTLWPAIIGSATSLGILAITQWRAIKEGQRRDERDAALRAQERKDRDRERLFEHRREAYLTFMEAARMAIRAIRASAEKDEERPGEHVMHVAPAMSAVTSSMVPVLTWGTKRARHQCIAVAATTFRAGASVSVGKVDPTQLIELRKAMRVYEATVRADLGVVD